MISLTRFVHRNGSSGDHEFKNIIQAFANSVSEGMLPNRFPDRGETPGVQYNRCNTLVLRGDLQVPISFERQRSL